jgi:hypothetical protein
MIKNCPQCGGLIGLNAEKIARTLENTFVCEGHPQPSPQDTQFRQWATAVWDKLLGDSRYIDVSTGMGTELDTEDSDHKPYIDILARAGYVLVEHTFTEFWSGADAEVGHYPDMESIPDLPELPEEKTR